MTTPRALANLVTERAQTDTRFLTFRGLVKNRPAQNYVSLYFGGGLHYSDSLVGSANSLTWSFRPMCIGLGEEGDDRALYVLGCVRSLFTNWRPFGLADGWFTEAPDDPPLIRDDSVLNDVRFSITPRFTITTRST